MRDKLGRFKKGYRFSPKTEFKKGQHNSLNTEFKKGIIPWDKGKKRPDITGEKHPNWKETISYQGYIYLHKFNHPFCDNHGYIRRSRFIVEQCLKRYLKSTEIVHHINEITNDDRIRNFIVFKNCGYHIAFHRWGCCNPKGIIFDGRCL